MDKSTPLLKKVYDTYKSEDWTFTQDNLNPLREVNPRGDDDINELRKKAIDKIAAKVAKIRDDLEAGGIKFKTLEDFASEEQSSIPFGGESIPQGISPDKIMENFKTGKQLNDTDPFFIPARNPFGPDVFKTLADYIEYLLVSLGADLSGSADTSDIQLIEGMIYGLLDLGCDNSTVKAIMTNIAGEENQKSGAKGSGSDSSDDSDSGDGDSDKDGAGSKSGDSAAQDMLENAADLLNPNDILNKYADDNRRKNAKDVNTLRDCAMKDLTWLMIILTILKVVSIMVNVTALAMGIISPIIKTVTLAAGAWANPAGISEIIQMAVEKSMAIMNMALSNVLQQLWNLLNMDCISSGSMSAMDKLNGALGMLLNVRNGVNKGAVDILNSTSTTSDKILDMQSAIKAAKERTNEDAFIAAVENITKDVEKSVYKGMVTDTLSTLKASQGGKLVNDLIKKSKSTQNQTASLKDTSQGKSAIQDASDRLVSRFDNLSIC
jgi:hypothetical protein